MSDLPKRDYDPSGVIAMFIAAALQHPNPPCNGSGERVSTILVKQHKNKFDNVIVYCMLAQETMVAEAWAEDGNVGTPSPEYVGRCMERDARVYRSSYRKMLFLVPQHREMMHAAADHGYLLHDDVNTAHVKIDELASSVLPGSIASTRFLLDKWHAKTVEELKDKLAGVYKHDW